jgi:hypothetical protein
MRSHEISGFEDLRISGFSGVPQNPKILKS